MFREIIHMGLHIALPAVAARLGFAGRWKRSWAIMMMTMAVDLDHLAAEPIFDPNRCSIGFHPLHSGAAIVIYLLLTGIPRFRIIGVGLLLHMVVDGIDCIWMRL